MKVKPKSTPALLKVEGFDENGQCEITKDLLNIIKTWWMQPKISWLLHVLMLNTISSHECFRASKFLPSKATLLKLLERTKNISILDQKCALRIIIVDKTTQRARPSNPYVEEYNWALKDAVFQPLPANGPLWPQDLSESFLRAQERLFQKLFMCQRVYRESYRYSRTQECLTVFIFVWNLYNSISCNYF